MPSFSLVLMRHASTESSRQRRLLGSLDKPLSSAGIFQAEAVAKLVALRVAAEGVARGLVVTSTLRRASQTAECVSHALGWPVLELPEFAERSFGMWAGRSLRELRTTDPGGVRRFVRDPLSVCPQGGENAASLKTRVRKGWTQVTRTIDAGTTPIVVTHDGPIRILLQELGVWPSGSGLPLYGIAPCACLWLISDSAAGTWRLAKDLGTHATPISTRLRG